MEIQLQLVKQMEICLLGTKPQRQRQGHKDNDGKLRLYLAKSNIQSIEKTKLQMFKTHKKRYPKK